MIYHVFNNHKGFSFLYSFDNYVRGNISAHLTGYNPNLCAFILNEEQRHYLDIDYESHGFDLVDSGINPNSMNKVYLFVKTRDGVVSEHIHGPSSSFSTYYQVPECCGAYYLDRLDTSDYFYDLKQYRVNGKLWYFHIISDGTPIDERVSQLYKDFKWLAKTEYKTISVDREDMPPLVFLIFNTRKG